MRTCTKCGEEKPEDAFYRNGRGQALKSRCADCDRENSKAYRQADPAREAQTQKAYRQRLSQMRKNNENIDRFIYTDSRRSDRKHGRENDLTREFIAEQIANGCSYCGETKIRMTLDRIDNARGHTQVNVVPACIRCNFARKTMPYKAWLVVAKGMREARLAGLFGGWTGRVK